MLLFFLSLFFTSIIHCFPYFLSSSLSLFTVPFFFYFSFFFFSLSFYSSFIIYYLSFSYFYPSLSFIFPFISLRLSLPSSQYISLSPLASYPLSHRSSSFPVISASFFISSLPLSSTWRVIKYERLKSDRKQTKQLMGKYKKRKVNEAKGKNNVGGKYN